MPLIDVCVYVCVCRSGCRGVKSKKHFVEHTDCYLKQAKPIDDKR